MLPCLHLQPLDAPTPLTPNPNTVAIDSLRRSFNPISATNLFPDETPDTAIISSTTEPAHFSDIDEDDPSPLDDDLIPQIDHEIPTNTNEFHRESPHPSSPHDGNDEPPSMNNDMMTQTQHNTPPQHNDTITPAHIRSPIPQPPLPILPHADALPLAPPLPTLPANRTTGNADDSITSGHVTTNVGPQDDITTFLLHIRRRTADNANSSSHDVTANFVTNVGMVTDTAAATDDTNALGASGANATIAIDIATGVTTSRCAVNTGDIANDTMTTDDPEPQLNDPDDDTPVINIGIASTVDITEDIDDATMAVDRGADAQPNGDVPVVPVEQQRQRKRRCSPAKIERQQRRRW